MVSNSDTLENEEIDKESFFVALRTHPILCLNICIISFNWFVCCHNLYGLVLVSYLDLLQLVL